MVRCHSLVSEAMVGLAWDAFEEFLFDEGQHTEVLDFGDHLEDLHDALINTDAETTLSNSMSVISTLKDIIPDWKRFRASLGATGKYWVMYVEMVSILKRFIRAERAGDWLQHLEEAGNMLPYIVAAKHTKYMSSLPLYLDDMRALPQQHPSVYENFLKGRFTVHRTGGTFNGTWTDMALEQTYNREGKSSLLKGISLNPAAREKYIKSVPFLTKVSENIKDMAQVRRTTSHHHGESMKQTLSDHSAVETIKKIVNERMINPFTAMQNDELLNIATGEKAESNNILKARELGIEALAKAEEEGDTKITPPDVTTFASRKKGKPSKTKALVGIYKDESSVSRALCFFQGSDEETRDTAFSHEWTSYPSSLFEVDPRMKIGYVMRKGDKSDYLAALVSISSVSVSSDLPEESAPNVFLIDVMAFVNRFQFLGCSTFDDVISLYLRKILSLKPPNCRIVHIVGDRYDFDDSVSLKGDERQRRSHASVSREFHPASTLQVPDFKEFISNGKNKRNLLEFLSSSLCKRKHLIPADTTLILGGCTAQDPGRTLRITRASHSILDEELSCKDHEEADTRIFAHLNYSVHRLGCTKAVIHASDTDVIIQSLYQLSRLSSLEELWIQKSPDKYLPVHILLQSLCQKYQKVPEELSSTLLSCYVLSGCDTVSFPFRRGKKKAARIALSMVSSLTHLSSFGDGSMEASNATIREATLFFTALYGRKGSNDLNILRQHLLASSKSDLRSLPPTNDAFKQHVLRALFQLAAYKRAHRNTLDLPNPTEFGRTVINGILCPVMMTLPPKPDIIQQPTSCKCKTSRCLRVCSCSRAGVECCVRCSCFGKAPTCGRLPDNETSSSSEDDE